MKVTVIGGGIVGASAAYHLAGHQVDVTLIDQADSGQATVAGSGVVFPGPTPGTSEPEQEFGLAAFEAYLQLAADLDAQGIAETGYDRVGLITVTRTAAELQAALESTRGLPELPRMQHVGEITELAEGEPASRFPVLAPELSGVFVSGFFRVDGRVLRDALLDAAARRGMRRRPGNATLTRSGRAVGVVVDGDQVETDAIVVAAGAWSGELCRPLGVDLPVFPHKGQTLRLALSDQETGSWPIIRTPTWDFLVPHLAGRIAAGGTREPEAGFDHRVTAGAVRQILEETLALAPGLARSTVIETRVGFRPGSRDGLPVLGPVAGLDGLVVATGLDTMGLAHGPYAGVVAADLTLGRAPDLDLAPFRPDRTAA